MKITENNKNKSVRMVEMHQKYVFFLIFFFFLDFLENILKKKFQNLSCDTFKQVEKVKVICNIHHIIFYEQSFGSLILLQKTPLGYP
jgi:hypothetical protein